MRAVCSLNDIYKALAKSSIFTCEPPMSYGLHLVDNQYSSKKLNQFVIRRYYNRMRKLVLV